MTRPYQMAVTLSTGGGEHLDVEVRFALAEGAADFLGVEVYGPLDGLLTDEQLRRVRRRAARWFASEQGQEFALEHVALREQVGIDFADKIEREAFIR